MTQQFFTSATESTEYQQQTLKENTMNVYSLARTGVLIIMASLLACTFAANAANAATITVLGEDTTTGANWRTTTTVKAPLFDPNGDNAYGSDGYFIGTGPIGSNVTTPTVLQSNPAYISSVTDSSPFFANGSNYVQFDDPSQPIGPSVSDVVGGLYYNSGTKFSFDVSADAEFVLTILLGGNPAQNSPPTSITVMQTAGIGSGSATATPLPPLIQGEYVFFNIDALAGDSFDVNIVATDTQGLVGLGFEQLVPVPESSSAWLAGLALLGLIGAGYACKKRRDVPGRTVR